MLLLSGKDMVDLLAPTQLISIVEDTARGLALGSASAPTRHHLRWGENMLLMMPAASPGGVGVKLVCVAPGNTARSRPVTTGLMILIDVATGAPRAVMNAATLTALRTGAVGALGVKHMTPQNVSSLGIVGCGVQGTWQAIFACAVRPVREIHCLSRSRQSFERFSSIVQPRFPDVTITACRQAEELLQSAQVIIAATTSRDPVLPNEATLLAGKHFVSIGSFRPDMQELPDMVYRLAGHIIVDSPAAEFEVGDVMQCLQREIVARPAVNYIGEVIAGHRRLDNAATTAYKTVGMALYDLDVALAMERVAVERGLGSEITL